MSVFFIVPALATAWSFANALDDDDPDHHPPPRRPDRKRRSNVSTLVLHQAAAIDTLDV
jgi:hypothetical protein